ncbi:MAG TPA: DUF3995 domain-containing protein [Hyphomicrobiaceae bacterium]|nr:DUF3995 domain-containing protein [Hyphomicrobiaceae bacterium]
MTLLAVGLCAVVACIAGLHAAWGLGSHWPAGSAERLAKAAVGVRGITRVPGARACFAVAGLLAAVALWPLFAAGLLAGPWPRWLTPVAGVGIAAVFIGRGLAGYTFAWRRRFSEEPFATLDARAYSPLCLLIGAGYGTLVLQGLAR